MRFVLRPAVAVAELLLWPGVCVCRSCSRSGACLRPTARSSPSASGWRGRPRPSDGEGWNAIPMAGFDHSAVFNRPTDMVLILACTNLNANADVANALGLRDVDGSVRHGPDHDDGAGGAGRGSGAGLAPSRSPIARSSAGRAPGRLRPGRVRLIVAYPNCRGARHDSPSAHLADCSIYFHLSATFLPSSHTSPAPMTAVDSSPAASIPLSFPAVLGPRLAHLGLTGHLNKDKTITNRAKKDPAPIQGGGGKRKLRRLANGRPSRFE